MRLSDSSVASGLGRPRSRSIDGAVLATTLRHLARDGLAGLSIAAVAADAGTTRPAVYRRWSSKEALAVAAVAHLAETDPPPAPTGEPFADLVAELEHFRQCITVAGALPLAGLMLTDGVSREVREAYERLVVAPRRGRLRAYLNEAVACGLLSPQSDLDVAGSCFTGSWYAFGVARRTPPDDWARRTVVLVWTGCGGRLD